MGQDIDIPTPKEDEILWPKGRQLKKLLPKFGSNRPPSTILGWKKYDNYQSK